MEKSPRSGFPAPTSSRTGPANGSFSLSFPPVLWSTTIIYTRVTAVRTRETCRRSIGKIFPDAGIFQIIPVHTEKEPREPKNAIHSVRRLPYHPAKRKSDHEIQNQSMHIHPGRASCHASFQRSHVVGRPLLPHCPAADHRRIHRGCRRGPLGIGRRRPPVQDPRSALFLPPSFITWEAARPVPTGRAASRIEPLKPYS